MPELPKIPEYMTEEQIVHDSSICNCVNQDKSVSVSLIGPKSSRSYEHDYVIEMIVSGLPKSSEDEYVTVNEVSNTQAVGTGAWGEAYANFVSKTAECLDRIKSNVTIDKLVDTKYAIEDLDAGTNDLFFHYTDPEQALIDYQDLCYCATTKGYLTREEKIRAIRMSELARVMPEIVLSAMGAKNVPLKPYYNPEYIE